MTKEELIKKIEDMPMDAEICLICPETGEAYKANEVNVSLKYNQIEIVA